MKTHLECIPCFFRQALYAARLATDDEEKQKAILLKVARELQNFSFDSTPIEMGRIIHRYIKEITGNVDPYRKLKMEYNELALNMLPQLREIVNEADDKLERALRVAVAGNIIDFGALTEFNLEDSIHHALNFDFAIFDYELFKEKLSETDTVIYIGDNAGEICFDRVLIEVLNSMGKRVKFAVRGIPIINDVTVEDAEHCGIHEVADVINSGSDAPGTILKYCNDEFVREFFNSNLIIAKGMGNYETLSDEKAPIFFLLKAKCPVVARELGVSVGDIVLEAARWLR